jgi:outer membrane protein TolC
LYNLKADNEKYLNNIKALNIQKKDFNYSQLKFDEGIISKLDLLQQNESLMYMEKLAASSKIDCYIDRIGLYKATGAQL